MSRPPEKQLEIDLLNTFFDAYKSDIPTSEVDDIIEDARETAKEDVKNMEGSTIPLNGDEDEC